MTLLQSKCIQLSASNEMSNSLPWLAVVGSTALVLVFSPAQATDLSVPVLAPRLADRDLLSVKYPKECESKAFKTRGSLNSCEEQEKCFAISYDKVDVPCENDYCDFKWKVCININKDNPCCRVKDGYYPFETACVRGNKLDSCVDDSVSFDKVKAIKELEFGDEYCELVTPGNNATFVLVSSKKLSLATTGGSQTYQCMRFLGTPMSLFSHLVGCLE